MVLIHELLSPDLLRKTKVFGTSYGQDEVPSDTKLLLTKNYSKIIIFEKPTNLIRNSLKKSLFPGDFEGTRLPQNYEK